jgi:Replication-relaxation
LNWTPEMFHRLKIIDLFLSLEAALDSREHIELMKILLSYRRIRHTLQRETTDYVGNSASETRIVPDGVFMLKNHQTGNSGLFMLEADMGTERLTAPKSRNQRSTITGKFELYDQYLQSGRFATTYAQWGQFRSFLLLFVAQAPDRVENIRHASAALTPRLHPYYRLGAFSQVSEDFLGPVWLSRDPSDTLRYALVKTGSA